MTPECDGRWRRYAGIVTKERVDPAAQLRLAFEMFEFGVAMMRQKLRRSLRDASDAEIEDRLDRWLAQETDEQTLACVPNRGDTPTEAP